LPRGIGSNSAMLRLLGWCCRCEFEGTRGGGWPDMALQRPIFSFFLTHLTIEEVV
jgi:hypothetical protein